MNICSLCGYSADSCPCNYSGKEKPLTVRTVLTFNFIEDGRWVSESTLTNDDTGDRLVWRIDVIKDGTFDVSSSDEQLTKPVPSFSCLAHAEEYCNELEGQLLKTYHLDPNLGRKKAIRMLKTAKNHAASGVSKNTAVSADWLTEVLAHLES